MCVAFVASCGSNDTSKSSDTDSVAADSANATESLVAEFAPAITEKIDGYIVFNPDVQAMLHSITLKH